MTPRWICAIGAGALAVFVAFFDPKEALRLLSLAVLIAAVGLVVP